MMEKIELRSDFYSQWSELTALCFLQRTSKADDNDKHDRTQLTDALYADKQHYSFCGSCFHSRYDLMPIIPSMIYSVLKQN